MLTVRIFLVVTTVHACLDTLEMESTAQVCYNLCDERFNKSKEPCKKVIN